MREAWFYKTKLFLCNGLPFLLGFSCEYEGASSDKKKKIMDLIDIPIRFIA
jgi:hypothetical protein